MLSLLKPYAWSSVSENRMPLLGENGYMNTYDWVPLTSIWNCHNLVNWLYSNIKYKGFFKKERKKESMLPQALRKGYRESEHLMQHSGFTTVWPSAHFIFFSKLNLSSLLCKMELPPPTCVTEGLSEWNKGKETCTKASCIYIINSPSDCSSLTHSCFLFNPPSHNNPFDKYMHWTLPIQSSLQWARKRAWQYVKQRWKVPEEPMSHIHDSPEKRDGQENSVTRLLLS